MIKDYIELHVTLNEEQDKNEFSFLDLIKNLEKPTNLNSSSSSHDNIKNDFLDIAKVLEKKYGKQVTIDKSGKKKRVRVDDYADIGGGYDSNDSFIDDSEANDIILAPNITNRYGGFFVQDGYLESIEETLDNIEDSNSSKPRIITTPLIPKDNVQLSAINKNNSQNPCINKSKSTADIKKDLNEKNLEESKENSLISTPVSVGPTKEKFFKIEPIDLPEEFTSIVNRLKDMPKNYKDKTYLELAEKILGFFQDSQMSRPQKRYASILFKEKTGMNKESIAKYLKNLRKKNESNKLVEMTEKLKEFVDLEIPKLLTNFNNEMENYQKRIEAWKENSAKIDRENALANSCGMEMTKKPPKPQIPRKYFRQSNQIKTLIESIVLYQLSRLESQARNSGQSFNQKIAEEQLKSFICTKLMPQWPEGWVTEAYLWRCCQTPFHKFCLNRGINNAPAIDNNENISQNKTLNNTNSINNTNNNTNTTVVTSNVKEQNSQVSGTLNKESSSTNGSFNISTMVSTNNSKQQTTSFSASEKQTSQITSTPVHPSKSQNNHGHSLNRLSLNIPNKSLNNTGSSEKKYNSEETTKEPLFPPPITNLKREVEEDIEILSVIPSKKLSISSRNSLPSNISSTKECIQLKESLQALGVIPNPNKIPTQSPSKDSYQTQKRFLTPFSMAQSLNGMEKKSYNSSQYQSSNGSASSVNNLVGQRPVQYSTNPLNQNFNIGSLTASNILKNILPYTQSQNSNQN